jgi:hypothetical protein
MLAALWPREDAQSLDSDRDSSSTALACRERDGAGRCALARTDDLLDLLPHGVQADPQRLQRQRPYAVTIVDEAEQGVLGR